MKKYCVIKSLIKRNQDSPSNSKINLPFVFVKRGSKENGRCTVATTPNEQKALISSDVRLQLVGNFQSMCVAKFLPLNPTKESNASYLEAIGMIKQRFGEIPSYLVKKIH